MRVPAATLMTVTAVVLLTGCGSPDGADDAAPATETSPSGDVETPAAVCPPSDIDCNDHPLPDGMVPVPDDGPDDGLDGLGNIREDADEADETTTGEQPADALADIDEAKGRARSLLGADEGTFDDVRVARRGDEVFMLTQDLVPGRITVELDLVDGVYLVTRSTVETSDGAVSYGDDDQPSPSRDSDHGDEDPAFPGG